MPFVVLVSVSGCGPVAGAPDQAAGLPASESEPQHETSAPSEPLIAPGPGAQHWFDLQAGDCIIEIPKVELGEIAVTVVDCATPHAAEVYLRAPLAVNTAILDIAGKACTAGFPQYTGQSAGTGPYAVTYLIDSNLDRTWNNPMPSTAICLLQAADGTALTASARRVP